MVFLQVDGPGKYVTGVYKGKERLGTEKIEKIIKSTFGKKNKICCLKSEKYFSLYKEFNACLQ